MRLVYKLFIKDYQNVKDSRIRDKYGVLAGIIGVVANVFLVIMKLIIGFVSNSISIIGDAINNLGDTMSSFINIFSFKINNKPADKEHPYGHRRSEYIGGFLISILIIVVAVELMISSIDKIINPTHTVISWWILSILIANIIIKTFMASLYHDSAKKIDSLSLKASYKDSLNDILTTLIIVLGLYISKYFDFEIDGYLGVLLSITIMISGVKLIKEAMDKLLGESLDSDTICIIVNDIKNNYDVIDVHDVLTHQYGQGKVFMTLHVEMDANYSLMEAHEIVDHIERKVKKEYSVDLLIHVDPIDFDNKELTRVKNIVNKTLYDIDTNLSSHDIRLSLGEEQRLYFDVVMPYSYQRKSKEIISIIIGELARKCKYKVSIEINYK